MLQAELEDINSQIEMLNQKNNQYQLFCYVLNDKERNGLLVSNYLQYVTVFTGGQIDTQLIC